MQGGKIREEHYAGESEDVIAKTWKGIHRSRENLVKRLSTESLIGLHQSIGYECCGNLLSTEPTSIQTLNGFLRGVNVVKLDKYFTLVSVFGEHIIFQEESDRPVMNLCRP